MDFDRFAALVGQNARKARWKAKLTQEEAASEVLTFRLLAALERGQGNPTLRTLFLLAKRYRVSVADLVFVAGDPPLTQPLRVAEVVQPERRRPSQRVRRAR